HEKTEHRSDIQTAAQLLQLTLLFDREDIDLLTHKIRTYKRNQDKSRPISAFEQLILTFLEKALRSPRGKPLRALFEAFHADLENLEATTQLAFDCRTELRLWSAARMTGRPVAELAEEMFRGDESEEAR
ncbi:MAG: hypothetical protein AAF570_26895, partial [Bacteroidota bacterium]